MPKRDAGNELNHDNWEVKNCLSSIVFSSPVAENILQDEEEPEEAGEFKKASKEAMKV